MVLWRHEADEIEALRALAWKWPPRHRIDLFFDRYVGNRHARPLLESIYPATEARCARFYGKLDP
jgi:hypothetical protein